MSFFLLPDTNDPDVESADVSLKSVHPSSEIPGSSNGNRNL